MGVRLSESLAEIPGWAEMVGIANTLLSEQGLEDYDIVVRPATIAEESEMGPGADVLPQFYPEQRRLQLAFKIEFEIVTVFGNRRVFGLGQSLNDPEAFAMAVVVDTLLLYLDEAEDDDPWYEAESDG